MARRYHETVAEPDFTAPKEPTTLDHFIKGLGPTAIDAAMITFSIATIVAWIYAGCTTFGLAIEVYQGDDLSWFTTPAYWAPAGYAALWLIGFVCSLIVDRGKKEHAAQQK